jgi:hypothetical protein
MCVFVTISTGRCFSRVAVASALSTCAKSWPSIFEHAPAEPGEALLRVVAEREVGVPFDRDAVVVVEADQVRELPVPASEADSW